MQGKAPFIHGLKSVVFSAQSYKEVFYFMPLLFYEPESETRGKVYLMHYMPDQLTAEERAKGVSVSEIPEAERIRGKAAVLYVNPKTGELWHEHVDIPLTQEEQMEDLREQNLDLMAALADIAVATGAV